MNLEGRIDQFKTDGYTVFEGLHNEARMQAWRDSYWALTTAASVPGAPPVTWLSGLLEFNPALFLPMAAHPEVLDFAERVMGPFVQVDATAFNVFPHVPPADAAGKVNGWHRDRYAEIPQTRDYIRPWSCNTITYLQDLDAATGPLRVIAGSHRDAVFFNAQARGLPHPRETLIQARAGDVIFTHALLAHSGTPNTSGQPRYFLSVAYNRSWMKHRDNHAGPRTQALLDVARARNDRRLMRLLGDDPLLWERSNPYFMSGSDEARWAAWTEEDRAALRPEPDKRPIA